MIGDPLAAALPRASMKACTSTEAMASTALRDFKDNVDHDTATAQDQDFPGQVPNRTLVFDYDSEGNLVRCSGPAVAATPQGNDFPNGKTYRYKYITESDLPGLVTGWNTLTVIVEG